MPYLKIPFDSLRLDPIDLPEDSREWLHACYDAIGCDCIEVASTFIPDLALIVDESGKCWDGWEDRINPLASILYGSPNDPIVGTAILARRVDPDIVPLTSEDVAIVRRILKPFLP